MKRNKPYIEKKHKVKGMKWNKPYDDRSVKNREFTLDPDSQLNLYFDDIDDYHKCAQYGRSGYYRALYWTLAEIDCYESHEY